MKSFSLVSVVAAVALPRGHGLDEACKPPCIPGDESIMFSTKELEIEKNLRWGCDRAEADQICNHNRRYAEPAGYWRTTAFLDDARKEKSTIAFYDSNTGKLLFRAPENRTMGEFLTESRRHGWPSFRDSEVNWDNVRVLPDGETVSVDGTHLGHNLPDASGNRFCINLLCIAARAGAKDATTVANDMRLSREESDAGLPMGIPALLVLVLVTALVLAPSMVIHGRSAKWLLLESGVAFRARCVAVVAAVFWSWAIYHVARKGDPDLGVVSFVAVLIACAFAVASRPLASKLMAGATGLVALNYLLGIAVTASVLPWTCQLYLAAGAAYWTAIGLWTAQGFRRESSHGETASLVSSRR